MSKTNSRRNALKSLAALGTVPLAGALSKHVYAQTAKPIRIGYIHIPTCDGQMWLMKEMNLYAKEGLAPEFTRFNTGIEGFSALVGGSLDVFTTGGVTHNFPARGQGVVILPNVVEWGGQVFGRGDAGITKLADLKGKKVATTLGTTGQLILHTALKSVGLDSTKDIDIISQTMPSAVTSYVTGSAPALATWVPFNLRAKEAKTSQPLAEARQFGPKAGYVLTAYSASKRTLETGSDLIKRLVAAWGPANEMMLTKKEEAANILVSKYYKDELDIQQMRANFDAMDLYSSAKWAAMMKDGTLLSMLDAVTNIFVEIGAIQTPLPASKYSDFSAFMSTYKTA